MGVRVLLYYLLDLHFYGISVLESKEDRPSIGTLDITEVCSVKLLLGKGKFMLLDASLFVVLNR